jgi:hypothetical protein
MTTIETIKAIKDYGLLAVAVIVFVWMNGQLSEQKQDIKEIQGILYDCFEDRIKENTRAISFEKTNPVSIFSVKPVCVLPEEIEIKKA